MAFVISVHRVGDKVNVANFLCFSVPLPMSTRRERAKAPATKLNKQLVAAEEATKEIALWVQQHLS